MDKSNVVVLGKFDGVHVAHECLIKKAAEIARKLNKKTLVYSMQKKDISWITNEAQKEVFLKSMGADSVVFRTLDKEFMSMSADAFVKDILIAELGASHVVVGENFRFGKDRSADVNDLESLLNEFGVEVTVIDTIQIDGLDVSSTAIRNFLSNGEIDKANKYLGRRYYVKGRVSEGKHLGRTLGFPTVNIYPDNEMILPKNGVYLTHTKYNGKTYNSITNIGINPTIDNASSVRIETHIFDFEDELYGEEITVEFIDFIREEITFDSVEQLQEQVEKDKQKAIEKHKKSFAE